MSFGCYKPDVNTALGCRQTTANMGLREQRLMTEKFGREVRNPITGELMSYGSSSSNDRHRNEQSSVYSAGEGFNAASEADAARWDSCSGKKMMPEQRHVGHLKRNFTVQHDDRASQMEASRIAEGNLRTGSMLPTESATTHDYPSSSASSSASSVGGVTRSKMSHAGGDCGAYLKPKDQLGPGLVALHGGGDPFRQNEQNAKLGGASPRTQKTRGANSRMNLRPTEFGYMASDPVRGEANAERLAAHLLREIPAAKYWNVFND
ncbi:unnamed protein product [Amoebophrya sp. A25]|nr:unnamed protein product [Amoebophrya sp. A25]|eukprot:GSA25T00000093001.1